MKNNSISEILKKIFIPLLSAVFLLLNTHILNASEAKDLILVVDTSLSMGGNCKGCSNIMPQVKQSLPQFIDRLEDEDSLTLITFDTTVKVYPTVYIEDKKNKESLIEYIKNIKVAGAWTYTSQMMRVAFRKAAELEARNKDRERVIIVLTDTLDDPPPGKLNDGLNIKQIAKNYKDKEWFVFFYTFGEVIKNNPKLARLQDDLRTNVSKYSNVVEVKTVPAATGAADKKTGKAAKGAVKTDEKTIKTAIEKDLSENIKKMEDKKLKAENGSFPFKSLIIALIVIAALLAALYYFKTHSGLKVTGSLEYWDHTMISPYFENYSLTKQNSKEILVGPKSSNNLTIRDIEITDAFKIFAIRVNGEVKSTLQAGKGHIIEYVNREPDGYLKNGDMFKVANYSFKYKSA